MRVIQELRNIRINIMKCSSCYYTSTDGCLYNKINNIDGYISVYDFCLKRIEDYNERINFVHPKYPGYARLQNKYEYVCWEPKDRLIVKNLEYLLTDKDFEI